MEVEIGTQSSDLTFQDEFQKVVSCVHCQELAGLIFVAHEMNEPIEQEGGQYVKMRHFNDPDGEGYWPHDAICVANYLCRKCFKITAHWNQA